MSTTLTYKSPITGSNNIELISSIKSKEIIDKYLNEYKFDVSHYFKDLDSIEILRCKDTGYTFYYPYGIHGNEDLYQHLEQFDFYYLNDRWEFNIPPLFTKTGANLLEIGCGNGYALFSYKQKGINCTGLELNKEAIRVCEEKGISIYNQTIESFSIKHSEEFDTICAFQLLEHLSDINSFLTSAIKLLKKNGNLIISVPNNDSFGHKFNTLNLPPHHMGMWNYESLSSLSKFFPIDILKVYYTPLNENQQIDFKAHFKNVFGKLPFGIRSISRLNYLFNLLVPRRKKGYSIVVVYQKR